MDEQVSMVHFGHPDKCIYCLLTYSEAEVKFLTRKKDDLFFSFTLLEHSYSEVHAAYEAAIKDNHMKLDEIALIRKDLLAYLNVFGVKPEEIHDIIYVDPNDPMQLKKKF